MGIGNRRCGRGGIAATLALLACGGGSGGREPTTPTEGGGAPPPAPAATEPGPVPVPSDAPAAATAGVVVFFRLDPRLTTSHYMGERWVAPERFTLVSAGEPLLEARARFTDARGMRDVVAAWSVADPSALSTSAAQGHEVAITVLRAGSSSLTVTHAGQSRLLTVHASQEAGTWRVDVTQ